MVERFPVLVASSDPEHRRVFGRLLQKCGLEPRYVTSVRELMEVVTREHVPLAFCAEALTDGTFRDVLGATQRAGLNVPVVVASRLDDTAEYVEAMSLGAFDFIASPYAQREVEWIVNRAMPQVMAGAA
jgi:DNA-binding NtrC family response regulator